MNDSDRIGKLVDITKEALARETARADRAEAELDRVTHELDKALATIERLKWLQVYRPGLSGGRCRKCGGNENDHRMNCQYYVGPLTHEWHFVDVNGTFGGYDYDCTCGNSMRVGGLNGVDSLRPCSNVNVDWRGERPQ